MNKIPNEVTAVVKYGRVHTRGDRFGNFCLAKVGRKKMGDK